MIDHLFNEYLNKLFLGLLLFAAALTAAGCFGDNPEEQPRPTPAILDSLSTYRVQPGDTIVLWGREFAADPAENLVFFNNNLASAAPFAGGADHLEAAVPTNAATGPVWVEKQGTRSNGIPLEVVHGLGEVWLVEGTEATYTFKVPVSSTTERFLIIPHAATEVPGVFSYDLTPGGVSVVPSPQPIPLSAKEKHRLPCIGGKLCEWVADVLERESGKTVLTTPAPSPKAPQDTMTFYVLNTTTPSVLPNGQPDPDDFTAVEARLEYTGRRCYVYQDLASPAGGFTSADFRYFGELFDGSIYPTDSTSFGPPTDIDGNKRVVVLFTAVVNGLTPPGTAQSGFYAGFFAPNDLMGDVFPPGTTNNMEIFYALVPDPLGVYGNVFSSADVKSIVPPTLAHEFEHMISFGYRIFHYGANYTQARWLEEGMAHMAEDLNGMNGGNISRVNEYLPDPGSVAMMGDDTLEQRGAVYLLIRYLVDRLGAGILRAMVESSKVGSGTIELVTGENFFTTLADWLATLYLSGRSITTDSKYRYTSIDLRDTGTFVPLAVTARRVSDGTVSDAVAGSGGDFFVITDPSPPGVEFAVDSAAPSAAIRLIVVRIQ